MHLSELLPHAQVLSHLLMLATVTCLASLEQNLENEDSALLTRGGKSLLGTSPFNARAVDDLNVQESRYLADNTAPAPPASQTLDLRDAKQVEISI